MDFPARFIQRLRAQMGADESRALLEALDTEPPTAVRANPAKGWRPAEAETDPVPWWEGGCYLSQRPLFTVDPAFHAGCYYVQEAASQFVGRIFALCSPAGKRILDLCAAPGGKTTLYASMVGLDGLVVANEIDRRRVQVLSDNVRKWGMGNVAVVAGDSPAVCAFAATFDVVAVDAPCSGEGMFRKDPNARAEWSEEHVNLCVKRQQALLDDAWRALKPGGLLIYSTCTFNREEDEQQLDRLFERVEDGEFAEAPEVPCDPTWGIVTGRVGRAQTFRFFPHRTRSEGLFVSVVAKSAEAQGPSRPSRSARPRRSPLAEVPRAACRELAGWLREPDAWEFVQAGDTCYAFRRAQAELIRQLASATGVIYSGVAMGQLYNGRLKPDHALALATAFDRSRVPSAELDEERAVEYLRRGAVAPQGLAEGMNLVTHDGRPIGFAKRIGRRVNNLYPQTMRILNK